MSIFESKINQNSDIFAVNRKEMLALVDDLHELKKRAETFSERRRPRFDERGQLTPRERFARLLDPGMPFLELYGIANYMVETKDREKSIPGASSLAGIGFVNGVRCMVFVDDSGINAGALTAKSGEKIRACLKISLEKKTAFCSFSRKCRCQFDEIRSG